MSRRRRTKPSFAAPVELLEDRRLMSVSVIAISGDAAPGGGTYAAGGFGPATIADNGQVAFAATIGGAAANANKGIFVGTAGAVANVVRTGAAAPDGNGVFDVLNPVGNVPVAVDGNGHVAFAASFRNVTGGATDGLFFWDGASVLQYARAGQAAPDGNGTYAAGPYVPSLASNGVVTANLPLTGATDGAASAIASLELSNKQVLLRAGVDSPDSDGTVSLDGAIPVGDGAGGFIVRTDFDGGTSGFGIVASFVGNGVVTRVIARPSSEIPSSAGGGTFGAVGGVARTNSPGQFAFIADSAAGRGIFRSTAGIVARLTGTGLTNNAGGTLDGIGEAIDLDASGRILFVANDGLYLADSGGASPVVLNGAAASIGGTLSGIGAGGAFTFDDNREVAFAATRTGGPGGGATSGLYFKFQSGDPRPIVEVGDTIFGGTVTAFSMANGRDFRLPAERATGGLSDEQSVAFNFTLADGRTGVALGRPDSVSALDFGDAANGQTLLAENGARHVALGPRLGSAFDSEVDATATADATGDDATGTDDEDGVAFGAGLFAGRTTNLTVTASSAAVLDAWIDFDGNGTLDGDERAFTSRVLAAGPNVVPVAVPSGTTIGNAVARFRLSIDGGLGPIGQAIGGEVEDYLVPIAVAPIEPPSDTSVTIAALDALTSEAAGDTATLRVTRAGPTTAALTVSYARTGSAVAGTDYSGSAATVVIPAGQAFADVTLAGIDNALDDGDRAAILTLTAGAGYALGTAKAVTVTVADDDPAEVPNAAVAGDFQIVGPVSKVKPGNFVGGAKGGAARVRVTNAATATGNAAGLVSVSFFASIDGAVEAGDAPLATVTKQLNLKPGKSKDLSVKFLYPTGLLDGAYFVVAKVDPDNAIPEALERNNAAASPVAIGIAAPFVDFSAGPVAAKAKPITPGTKSAKVKAAIAVTNLGNFATNTSVVTRFFLSTDDVIDGADVAIGDLVKTLKVKPNKAAKLKATVIVPAGLAAGNYFLLARVDAAGTVPEPIELNNDAGGPTLTLLLP